MSYIIMNGIIAGTANNQEQYYKTICDYFNFYGCKSATIEVRTNDTIVSKGFVKHEYISYSLYQEQKAKTERNFCRGLLTECQCGNCINDIREQFFKQWYDLEFFENISKLTVEMISERKAK